MREGLMDDTGIDFECDPPCEKCKFEGIEVINGRTWFKCMAQCEICDFKEKEWTQS